MKELIHDLVKTLKIDEKQATGGAGILFKAAKDKLGAEEFNRLLGKVAGLESLIGQAPAPGSVGKLFGGFATALGGNAGLITSIVTGFGKLGLSTNHAKQFVPVILKHLRAKAGQEAVDKLETTLRS